MRAKLRFSVHISYVGNKESNKKEYKIHFDQTKNKANQVVSTKKSNKMKKNTFKNKN